MAALGIELGVTGAEIITEGLCAATFSRVTKVMVPLASAYVLNHSQDAIIKLAKQYGADPAYVQMGVDAFQVGLLLLAARNQSLARGIVDSPTVGRFEGATELLVRDPATGDPITDIDKITDGVLWEEKTATFAGDNDVWVQKHIIGKFNSYLRARQFIPGYENAPIGFDLPPESSVDAGLAAAIKGAIGRLQAANPNVEILTNW